MRMSGISTNQIGPLGNLVQLPECKRCGARGAHNIVRIALDEPWYLCPEPCLPLFRKASEDWLRHQKP